MTSKDMTKSTCSQDVEAGPWPLGSPAFQTTLDFGPALAPANHSAPQADEKALQIRAIFGRRCFGSLKSAALQLSLENKCRQRFRTDGSTWFSMRWKESITPAGRSIFRLVALARDKFDSGYGGLPTLLARDSRTAKGAKRCKGAFGTEPLLTIVATLDGASDGHLNPAWAAWFMGFDQAIVSCGDSAMQSLSRSPRSSSPPTSNPNP